MIMMRWGSWPSWIALTIRTLQLNPTITFHIVGDQKPGTFGWPDNCRFHKLTVSDVMKRAQQVLGASPGSLEIAGTASKISDFKPMLAALYPEMVEGCGFWGYMQEDQFLGSMRSFLDEPMLSAFDTISPLPQPMYNAGPFMLYRRSKQVDALYRRSAEWRRVVRDPSYMVFDEWWGPSLRDHMPAVIGREARQGRLRAYTAQGLGDAADKKVWLTDDFVYGQIDGARVEYTDVTAAGRAEAAMATKRAAAMGPSAMGPSPPPPPQEEVQPLTIAPGDQFADPAQPKLQRWYDDTAMVTWRRGYLWGGFGTASTLKTAVVVRP